MSEREKHSPEQDDRFDVPEEERDLYEDDLEEALPEIEPEDWEEPADDKNSKKKQKKEKKRQQREEQEQVRLKKTNRDIRFIGLVLTALFLSSIVYLGYFLVFDADTYRNSSYNSKRQALLAERYNRGDILAMDGTVLATTVHDDAGNQTRKYPMGSLYAHAVGYSKGGVAGMESIASSYLLDSHSNIITQMVKQLKGERTPGDTVRSTLEPELQKVAYDALGSHKGAVVVMDPATGHVLAEVSKPDFDPNELDGKFDEMDEGVLVNRATQGMYTPGSTFKILTALEYMRENPNSWDDFHYNCSGLFHEDTYSIRCYEQTAHGSVDLKKSFAHSCNGTFASIGSGLNFRKFHELCESMGYNKSLGVGGAKSKFVLNNSNSLWTVLQTSIGQGETQVTPILNCMIVSAVANGGKMMMPTMVDSVINDSGRTVSVPEPVLFSDNMTEEEAAALAEMMAEVCASGTGTKAAGDGYKCYGKTGSAEIANDGTSNAWFVGYAEGSDPDAKYPKVAVSIVLEEGGSGGSVAAPIARKIFEAAFR